MKLEIVTIIRVSLSIALHRFRGSHLAAIKCRLVCHVAEPLKVLFRTSKIFHVSLIEVFVKLVEKSTFIEVSATPFANK